MPDKHVPAAPDASEPDVVAEPLQFDFLSVDAKQPQIAKPIEPLIKAHPEHRLPEVDDLRYSGGNHAALRKFSKRTWVIALLCLIGGYVYLSHTRYSTATAIRTDAISAMQAECAINCSAYDLTVNDLGQPLLLSHKDMTKDGSTSYDDVFLWRAGPDITLTLHRIYHPWNGAANDFTWSSSALARDPVDVDQQLSHLDRFLQHTINDYDPNAASIYNSNKVKVHFVITPKGRATNIKIINESTNDAQLDQKYIDLITGIDFGAGRYAPMEKTYVVNGG